MQEEREEYFMSYSYRYHVKMNNTNINDAYSIAAEIENAYSKKCPNSSIEVLQNDNSISFETFDRDELFFGFEDSIAEELSKKYPLTEFEWTRTYAGDYSGVQTTFKNGNIISTIEIEPANELFE